MGKSWRLDAGERQSLQDHGFVLRRDVFNGGEIDAIRDACEALIEQLVRIQRQTKLAAGSYAFEIQQPLGTVVKWEPDELELVQGAELFAHLSDALRDWGLDARFVDPARHMAGAEDIALFTEKLNLKRANKGGPIVLHQDYPYWSDVTPLAPRIATAMLFLDDATRENGCLEVVPGSHREGVQPRKDIAGFGGLEMEPARFDVSRLVPLEVSAGSVAFFGPFLVHRSLPNRSGGDRRALLYSYQPAGNPHLRELLKLGPHPQHDQ